MSRIKVFKWVEVLRFRFDSSEFAVASRSPLSTSSSSFSPFSLLRAMQSHVMSTIFSLIALMLLLVSGTFSGIVIAVDDAVNDLKFSEYAHILAHHAPSIYAPFFPTTTSPLTTSSSLENFVLSNAITNQRSATNSNGTLVDLLDSGARAMDMRMFVKADGSVIFHHGVLITIDTPLETLIADADAWLSEHPTELITFNMWQCEVAVPGGDPFKCGNQVSRVLAENNVHTVSDCSTLSNCTVGQMKEAGARFNGGALVAIFPVGENGETSGLSTGEACSLANFNPSVDRKSVV